MPDYPAKSKVMKSRAGWSLNSLSSRIIRHMSEISDPSSTEDDEQQIITNTFCKKRGKVRRRCSLPPSLYKNGRPQKVNAEEADTKPEGEIIDGG